MNLQTTDKAGALIAFAAVIVVVYGLQMAKVLMVPLLLATFIALITMRPMLWMQQKRVPAVLAALIIVIFQVIGNSFNRRERRGRHRR